jgi:hypothetical protein
MKEVAVVVVRRLRHILMSMALMVGIHRGHLWYPMRVVEVEEVLLRPRRRIQVRLRLRRHILNAMVLTVVALRRLMRKVVVVVEVLLRYCHHTHEIHRHLNKGVGALHLLMRKVVEVVEVVEVLLRHYCRNHKTYRHQSVVVVVCVRFHYYHCCHDSGDQYHAHHYRGQLHILRNDLLCCYHGLRWYEVHVKARMDL